MKRLELELELELGLGLELELKLELGLELELELHFLFPFFFSSFIISHCETTNANKQNKQFLVHSFCYNMLIVRFTLIYKIIVPSFRYKYYLNLKKT